MTTKWMAGVLVGTALICASYPSVAQEQGKTEAAELATASQKALQQLYADRASGEGTRAHRRSRFWSSRKSRRPASGLVVSMARARC